MASREASPGSLCHPGLCQTTSLKSESVLIRCSEDKRAQPFLASNELSISWFLTQQGQPEDFTQDKTLFTQRNAHCSTTVSSSMPGKSSAEGTGW